jgi:signal transduction histidine kinase
VQDHGKGMPRRPASTDVPRVGLQGMRERARQLGGSLEIHSDTDGTTVEAILPLAAEEPRWAADAAG